MLCGDFWCHNPFIFLFHSNYYHCFVVFSFFSLFVCFSFVCFALSSSWNHSPRCHWPCLAELSEKDVEMLRSLPLSWPSKGVGQSPGTPKWGALQVGQAKGDNYPKYSSVDEGKIFLLLYIHQNSCLLICDRLIDFKKTLWQIVIARSNVNKIQLRVLFTRLGLIV